MQITREELSNMIISDRPHVVILGAGASRATCPNGDANGKKLPLMSDFVDCLNMRPKLEEWGIDPNQNFEDIFSNLFEQEEKEKKNKLEKIIYNYFNSLKLQSEPTIYDHMILSLRETDLIASFNWDPLLLQAYRRNSSKGIKLPRLAFLHGNVMMGSCKEHKVHYVGQFCESCKKPFRPVKLLYPIKQKNYAQNETLKTQWRRLETNLKDAYRFTIFGYSAPKTDVKAVSIMKKAWKEDRPKRILADITIITPDRDKGYEHWEPFIRSHYFTHVNDFYKSSIATYPRRGFEASWKMNLEVKSVDVNPIPQSLPFPDIWGWYREFIEAENKHRQKNPLRYSTST